MYILHTVSSWISIGDHMCCIDFMSLVIEMHCFIVVPEFSSSRHVMTESVYRLLYPLYICICDGVIDRVRSNTWVLKVILCAIC